MNTDLETISARLQEAQDALSVTEAEYSAAALDAALSDAPGELEAIEAKVAAARLRVETLGLAEMQAQQNEHRRLAAARSDAERARCRAISQHVGAMVKAAENLTHFQSRAVDCFRQMIAAGRRLELAMTPDEARSFFGYTSVDAALKQYVTLDLYRLGTGDQKLARFPLTPKADSDSYGGLRLYSQALRDVPPINDLLKAKYGSIGAAISGEKPMPPVEPETPTEAEPSPEAEAAEIVAGPEAEDKIYGTPISELRDIHARKPEIFEAGIEIATAEEIEFAAAVAIVSTVDDAVPPSPRELIDAVNLLSNRKSQ